MKNFGRKGSVIVAVCSAVLVGFAAAVNFAILTLQPSIFALFE